MASVTTYDASIAAMRDKRTQADNWRVGDALVAEVPQNAPRRLFDAVRVAADAAGVRALSVSALRQYRDTAVAWPPAARIPGVSFSAHRAAMRAHSPATLLGDLATTRGAENVTVRDVETALRATGATTPRVTTPAGLSLDDATARDLLGAVATRWASASGRNDVLAALRAMDNTRAELRAMLDDAETRNAAASRKANAWGAPRKTTDAATPAASGKLGNVRGL